MNCLKSSLQRSGNVPTLLRTPEPEPEQEKGDDGSHFSPNSAAPTSMMMMLAETLLDERTVIALLFPSLPSPLLSPLLRLHIPGRNFRVCVYSAGGKVSRHCGPPANQPIHPPFLGIERASDVTFDNYIKTSNRICPSQKYRAREDVMEERKERKEGSPLQVQNERSDDDDRRGE